MTIIMNTGATGLALIRAFEQLRLTGYLDAARPPVATIGYGHTERAGGTVRYADGMETPTVFTGKPITEAEAERLLRRDVRVFESGVLAALTRKPDQDQFDAMVSLAFNVGVPAFKRSSVVRHFNAGRVNAAADAFLLWNKAGGRVLNGLVRRRNAERALFLGDIASASRYAQVTLPGYGARLENPAREIAEEARVPPDPVQGTPPLQSTTIWSQIAAILTTVGTAAAQAFGAIDWKTAAVITAGGVAAFGIYTIAERMRHSRENGT